jgi:hypothetical protein
MAQIFILENKFEKKNKKDALIETHSLARKSYIGTTI